MRQLPSGVVTFLFSDIEGSTRLLHELGAEEYAQALAEHRAVMRSAFTSRGGVEVDTQGDAFFVAFGDAAQALAAAEAAQRGLDAGPVNVRMGVHTGQPLVTEEGYVGMDVHHGARIMSAGHGGQVLVSASTAGIVNGFELLDLGSQRLKDLSAPQRLYQLGSGEFPRLKTLYQTNLPVQAMPLIGREAELVELAALLAEHRLVTLLGPGGSGKTRLALQAAAEAVDEFPDGVWWAPLQSLRDAALVPGAIAQAVGAKGDLAEHVGDKRMLVLLDNVEQVIDAAGELADLLAATANLRLLVTSREPLRIAAEREFEVGPLPEGDAVDLFTQRAVVAEPREVVREICRRLDFLPLAVELAAARTKILPPPQLLARLEQRLPLLTGARRDVPERQRTLRATIEWSHDLLDHDEQQAFARLAVFAGSFDLDAAEEVCDVGPEVVQSLLEKSLLRRWGSGRLGMLETIHEFAAERLIESGEEDERRRRHARYFADLAERAEREYFGPAQPEWLERFRSELPNLRAAIAGPDDTDAARVAGALPFAWFSQGLWHEGRRSLASLRSRLDGVPLGVRAKVIGGLSTFVAFDGEAKEAVALSDDSLELARGADDWTLGQVLIMRQMALGACGQDDGYEAAARAAIELGRARGDELVLAVSLNNLADLELRRGRYAEAKALLDESLALITALGDAFNIAGVTIGHASALLELGQTGAAAAEFEAALRLAQGVGGVETVAIAAEGLAAVAARVGDAEWAARLFGAVDTHVAAHELTSDQSTFEARRRERTVALLTRKLGPDRYAACLVEGRELELEQALTPADLEQLLARARG